MFNYLISNESYDLKTGIEIKCTVLGISHQESWLRRTKSKLGRQTQSLASFENQLFGAGVNESKAFLSRHIFKIPLGTLQIEKLFENKCLPIAITCAWLFNKV